MLEGRIVLEKCNLSPEAAEQREVYSCTVPFMFSIEPDEGLKMTLTSYLTTSVSQS